MSAQYYEESAAASLLQRASACSRVGPADSSSTAKRARSICPRLGDMETCIAPLTHIGQERSYDVSVHVNGGGITASATRSCWASRAPWKRSIPTCAAHSSGKASSLATRV